MRPSDKEGWILTKSVRSDPSQRSIGMANQLSVSVISVTVLTGSGTDLISIKFEGSSPYPEIQAESPDQDYGPSFKVETRKGYALEWLKSIGVPMDLINVIDSGRRA